MSVDDIALKEPMVVMVLYYLESKLGSLNFTSKTCTLMKATIKCTLSLSILITKNVL